MRDDGFSARAGGGETCSARTDADEALLEEVAAMLRDTDPVPPHVKDAARDLLTWQTVDAALAEVLRGNAPPARPAAC